LRRPLVSLKKIKLLVHIASLNQLTSYRTHIVMTPVPIPPADAQLVLVSIAVLQEI